MKRIAILLSALALCTTSFAQEQEVELTPIQKLDQRTETLEDAVGVLNKVKLSGYMQAQYQWGEKNAILKEGSVNENPAEPFSRIGIRRGRVKFAFQEGIVSSVVQLDLTEKGITIRDAFFDLKPQWVGAGGMRAGIFNRPFGDEIGYSSSARECPERSTVTTTLFPGERDLGAMLIFQANKTSPWNILKLEAGLFAGNGVNPETDSKRDFIGHLTVKKDFGNTIRIGGGVSYYNGSVFQATDNVYKMVGNGFELNSSNNKYGFAKREYYGVDGQFTIMSMLGMSQVRAEYLFGQQPGTKDKTLSPTVAPTGDTFIRPFEGGYVIFVQDLGKLPFSAIVKYDWYDPNTKVSGDQLGQNGTTAADVAGNTLGVGGLWKISGNVRMQAFYEFNKYEKNEIAALAGIKRDVFTLRLQVKY